MDTQNNNGKISFMIDADILNSHISVNKKNKRGYGFGDVVYICRKENKIHIKTTNGHILFHSIVNDSIINDSDSGEDFEVMVKIDKPFKYTKRSGGRLIVSLDESDILFRLVGDSNKMVFSLVRDLNFPNTDSAENFDGKVPTYYQPFDPKYVQMVVDYLGSLDDLAHPVCYRSEDIERQYKFVREDGNCEKIAVVMPIIVR